MMRACIVAGILLPTAVLVFGCRRTVTVKMTWVCGAPEHLDARSDFAKLDPAAKPVMLYFPRYPNEFLQDNSPGLCDALTAGKHREVPVVMKPISGLFGKYDGFTVITIDGHVPGGGYGGGYGKIGNDPNPSLEELLR